MRISFLDCVDLVGTAAKRFDGVKKYISTGAVNNFTINEDEVERVEYATKPSRANLQVQKGTILFAKMAETRKTLIIDDITEQCLFSTGFCAVKPKSNLITLKCLYYLVSSPQFLLQKDKKASGATQRAITNSGLANIIINLPSLEEQNELVKRLDELTAAMRKREGQLDLFNDLVKSQFIEMFGDPILNQKGFPLLSVSDVMDFQGGSQPDKSHFEFEPSADNVRLIQIRDYKTDKFITYVPRKLAKRFCSADDIMIGRYGPPIFQILKGIEGAYNVALMKAVPKMGNREFIRQFLKQDCLLHYLEGLSKRTAGQDGIQMDKLKAYPFPYPPIELQDKFARFVEQTDKSKVQFEMEVVA